MSSKKYDKSHLDELVQEADDLIQKIDALLFNEKASFASSEMALVILFIRSYRGRNRTKNNLIELVNCLWDNLEIEENPNQDNSIQALGLKLII